MLRSIKFLVMKYLFIRKWKSKNKHNETVPLSIFPIKKVTVGKMSYGVLDIRFFGNEAEKLTIGNYVSISENVIFILGGNHKMNTLTNFPLYSKLIGLSAELDANSKGEIVIGDEVWIGTGVIILSGVSIGKGTIIAAGSVVTKSTPPYSIVGGNPAKLIKQKFSTEIIVALRDFRLCDYDEDEIIDNIDEFYTPLDMNQINRFKKMIKERS